MEVQFAILFKRVNNTGKKTGYFKTIYLSVLNVMTLNCMLIAIK